MREKEKLKGFLKGEMQERMKEQENYKNKTEKKGELKEKEESVHKRKKKEDIRLWKLKNDFLFNHFKCNWCHTKDRLANILCSQMIKQSH